MGAHRKKVATFLLLTLQPALIAGVAGPVRFKAGIQPGRPDFLAGLSARARIFVARPTAGFERTGRLGLEAGNGAG